MIKNLITNFSKACLKTFRKQTVTKSLIPKKSTAGKIYNLIKVRKKTNLAISVVIMIGTQEYKSAKYFRLGY